MKYDPNIARQILKAMEAHESAEIPRGINLLTDFDIEVYFFHCRLLEEEGYISTYKMRFQGRVGQFWPRELKYAGVQFLQMFDDETLWQRAKKEASTKYRTGIRYLDEGRIRLSVENNKRASIRLTLAMSRNI